MIWYFLNYLISEGFLHLCDLNWIYLVMADGLKKRFHITNGRRGHKLWTLTQLKKVWNKWQSEYIHFAEIMLLYPSKQNKISQYDKCSYISTSIKAIYRENENRSYNICKFVLVITCLGGWFIPKITWTKRNYSLITPNQETLCIETNIFQQRAITNQWLSNYKTACNYKITPLMVQCWLLV